MHQHQLTSTSESSKKLKSQLFSHAAFPRLSFVSLITAKVLKENLQYFVGVKVLLWLKCCPCGYFEELCTSNSWESISAIFSRSVVLLHKFIFKNGN